MVECWLDEEGENCSSLLPDLLMALVGHTGDVFIAGSATCRGTEGVRLSPGVDWLSSRER